MTVSRRLFLVALLCLLPSLAAGLFIQLDLHERRGADLREFAMRQATLFNSDLHSVLDAARQVGAAAAQLSALRTPGGNCGPALAELHSNLPRYAFLATYDPRGNQRCASIVGLASTPDWLGELTAIQTPTIGTVARETALGLRFLPVGIPIATTEGARIGTLVVALDLAWMDRHVREWRGGRTAPMGQSTLMIADQNGALIALDQGPGHEEAAVGPRALPAAYTPLLVADRPGYSTVPGPEGADMLVAHVPPASSKEPVLVAVALSTSRATAEIDRVALRAAVMAGSASIIALILALAAGEAFIRRPTERLVAAARRWRVGDFSARAPAPDGSTTGKEDRSEFGRLATAFNEMAAALQERQAERERISTLLEQRVAERTRALSESNNRLQVEIIEREKTEAALAQAQKLQAVGRLAGGIAHDFNNLLATILGNLELIERRIDKGQERLHAMIQRAAGAVTRGSHLTARLLAFSRRHRPTTAAEDLNKLITDLLSLAASTLGRGIKVETKLDPALWPAMIDHNQVEAALLNLLLNARDAMPNGGTLTVVTFNETLSAMRDGVSPGDYVRIEVADTGIGMSEDVLRRAFEPFFTTKGPTGSGLGLSQVYGVANQTGGGVRIKSVQGVGTTVALLLPRATAENAATATNPASRAKMDKPPRVLLIDDDRAVLQATAEMLRELGCEVMDAQSGEEGLDILKKEQDRIGIILVDYAMPGLNGLETAAIARRMGFTKPIMMITGYAELGEPAADGEPVTEPDTTMINVTLRKPFSLRDLESTMARLLNVPAAA